MNTVHLWVLLVFVVSPVHCSLRTHPLSGTTMQKSVTVKNEHGLVLKDLILTSTSGNCLTLDGCSEILLQNVTIGPCAEVGIQIKHSNNVIVERSTISTSTGSIYAVASRNLQVLHTVSKGATGPSPRGQCFQSNDCDGPILIDNLTCLQSDLLDPEDGVNFYKTRGAKDRPIVIQNSYFEGGGPSKSGCGILLGDDDGSYQYALNNYLEAPGQCGIGMSGGSNNVIEGNVVYSPEVLPWSNVGIYVWDQHDSGCQTIEVKENIVYFRNKGDFVNDRWFASNCEVIHTGNEWLYEDLGRDAMLEYWNPDLPTNEPIPTTSPPTLPPTLPPSTQRWSCDCVAYEK